MMESNSSLLMCAKAYKLITLSLAFSALVSFLRLLICETDLVAFYHVVPYL